MQSHSTQEIADLVGLTPARVRALVRDGVLVAERRGRGYRFDFTDLVLLRTARSLMEQGVRYERVRRSLQALKQQLPEGRPLTAVRVRGLGSAVVVEDRGHLWEADSGQGQLRFEAPEPSARASVDALAPSSPAVDVDTLFERAMLLEDEAPAAAVRVYRELLEREPRCMEAHLNLGRLLQGRGKLAAAARHYETVVDDADYEAIARFNLGTVREEQGARGAAIALYLEAAEGGVVDAHYNLARLYELEGDRGAALRHLIRLTRAPDGH